MRIDWIIPQLLAGGSQPGLLVPLEEDVRQLKGFGFKVIVNLTEYDSALRAEHGDFEIVHFPIPDMGVPTPREMWEFCAKVAHRLDSGQRTVVHCKAGLGRTGTFLACYLVHQGREVEKAITEVRLVNRRFIQNDRQLLFVRHFAQFRDEEVGKE